MKYLYSFVFLVIISACGGNSSHADTSTPMVGLSEEAIAGTNATLATSIGEEGNMTESGILSDGKKDGTWVTYFSDGQIKTISSYVNGNLNGLHIELNNRGQIESMANYKNNEYHGKVAKFKFGKPLQEMSYKDGQLHGPFAEYTDRAKIQKKGFFKNGKQDGKLQFFDDEENLIMEYEYRDGNKISGGIVEKKAAEPVKAN